MMEKRKYEKPDIFYDDFELNQNIAGDCEAIANFAEGLCSVTVDIGVPLNIYQDGIKGCESTPPGMSDMVCYHAPSESNNIFSS